MALQTELIQMSIKRWFSRQRHHSTVLIYGSGFGYKLCSTRVIGNLGKSREALMPKRSICTDISSREAGNFYPELVKVGKEIIKEQV
jgi:hypothetical protein